MERGHRLARPCGNFPKSAESRQVIESVDQPPLERQDDQVAEEAAPTARRRAVGETEVLEELWRGRGQSPSRRPNAARPYPDLVHLADAPFQQTGFLDGAQVGPVFVAPAMVAKLVAGVGDLEKRLGVEFGVKPLYEESGPKPELVEHAQDARERTLHREVATKGLAFGPQPALEVGSFTQVVESHSDRCAPGIGAPGVWGRVGRVTHVSLLKRVGEGSVWVSTV